MKRLHMTRAILLSLTFLLLTSSCSDFDELNRDPNRLDVVNPGTLLDPILYGISTDSWNRWNSFTADLMQVSIPTNNLGGVSRYYVGVTAGDGHWSNCYTWLKNIVQMEKTAIKMNEPNYEAVGIVLRVLMYEQLVGVFGDVPMSEALRADEKLYKPKFDKQSDIYPFLIQELERANGLFVESEGLTYNGMGELLFGTNATLVNGKSPGILKWKKFANALRLRLLVRSLSISQVGAHAKLVELFANPTLNPLPESNDESAFLSLSGTFPYEAPMTRPQDFTAYRGVSSYFIDYLVATSDPRLVKWCDKGKDESNVSKYVGWESGYAIAPGGTPSKLIQALATAPVKVPILTHAEVEFLKAEVAQRGLVATLNAEECYLKGIESSVQQWGATTNVSFLAAVAYDGSLELILRQKYYALLFCNYQQWFDYQRTGYPILPRGSGVPEGIQMPKRYLYPQTTQRTNPDNYKAAVQSIGGDSFDTKLIWQQ